MRHTPRKISPQSFDKKAGGSEFKSRRGHQWGDNNMQTIPLTQGKKTIVDDNTYAWLSQYKWCAHKDANRFYAVRKGALSMGIPFVRMHRVVIGAKKGEEVDHINGDGLDNRRENLRIVTKRENQQNQHVQSTSKYTGVCRVKGSTVWQSYIKINGKQKHLGYFKDELSASEAYKKTCDALKQVVVG